MKLFKNSQSAPTLIVGSDLRVRSCSVGWPQLGAAPSKHGSLAGRRIHDIFPSTDIHGYVLDVLASGKSLEGIIIPIEGDGARFLSVGFHPLPANATKPRKVLIQASELTGQLIADSDTGEILDINKAAADAFGESSDQLLGQSIWKAAPLCSQERRASLFEVLHRKRFLSLGHFTHRQSGGGDRELEGALILIED